ncbi:NAD-dependent epimerase/dehydratase family protein [Cryptosporangium aurantiacum]|uniref:Nucleoside-diphosphate-sugar epimerase n=1 Tax=Cryptosporangium aurantiacum TaxID=134849 RepID=A0A1M7R932_9ACTN|nr:NAD(P)-dependent oxidoreductase [Cryptosporangium aurantiacum]SHN42756.1 Nucleoside-diphosphate-sugar epimerase [Cryptosporangium aurantiacum]
MRTLVTGARGKVGVAAVEALVAAGHDVTATDLAPPSFDRPAPDAPAAERVPYVRADLTDAGDVYALVGGFSAGEGQKAGRYDAVVHAGAIPAPGRHAPATVFQNNLGALFNVVEACVRCGVPRLVNISSETVTGFHFAERPWYPVYLPLDEEHPAAPQDPYGLAKHFGEQLCDAAVRRSDLKVLSLRPTWVQNAASYPLNLGPIVADPDAPSLTGWSYVDADDLGDAIVLAAESDIPGHEVLYIAAADTVGGRDLHASWRAAYPDAPTELRPVSRPDASGIDCSKAKRLLGWEPRRSWRDHVGPEPKP